LVPDYDSDIDYSDHVYQVGDKLDYQMENSVNWISAVVVDNLDEMVNIKLNNDQSYWIYYDEDRTGPHHKVQSHTINNVDFYIS
jgi:hypothetical protein